MSRVRAIFRTFGPTCQTYSAIDKTLGETNKSITGNFGICYLKCPELKQQIKLWEPYAKLLEQLMKHKDQQIQL